MEEKSNRRVKIENIRGISKMDFELPKSSKVYVLTGTNGSGKTTLLTCLRRIGEKNAFREFFRAGGIEKYTGKITYSNGKEEVMYRHAETRRPPKPRKNSGILKDFGYSTVHSVSATGKRMFIQSGVLGKEYLDADKEVKEQMNEILGTNKFDNLKYAKVEGRGNSKHRLRRAYIVEDGDVIYSERVFSLGEILILNTLILVKDIPEKALLLIDEIEMALHPRAQVKLLSYLAKKAEENDLTIILSTHSSSLIKAAENLIYIQKKERESIIHRNPYSNFVLGDVATISDIDYDYYFCVEDKHAKKLLEQMLKKYLRIINKKCKYKILPIGGHDQLADFIMEFSDQQRKNKVHAFFDQDVDANKIKERFKEYCGDGRNSWNKLIHRLPITPEVGMYNMLIEGDKLDDLVLETDGIVDGEKILNDDNGRKKAKSKMKNIIEQGRLTKKEREKVREELFKRYVDSIPKGELLGVFNPIFTKK